MPHAELLWVWKLVSAGTHAGRQQAGREAEATLIEGQAGR
jgi:hypothetical protein